MTLPVDAQLPVCLFRMLRRRRTLGFGGRWPDRPWLPVARRLGFRDALRRADGRLDGGLRVRELLRLFRVGLPLARRLAGD